MTHHPTERRTSVHSPSRGINHPTWASLSGIVIRPSPAPGDTTPHGEADLSFIRPDGGHTTSLGHRYPAPLRTGGFTTSRRGGGCLGPALSGGRCPSPFPPVGAWRTARTIESGCRSNRGFSESVLSAAPRHGRQCRIVESFLPCHSLRASHPSGKQSPGRVPGRGCHSSPIPAGRMWGLRLPGSRLRIRFPSNLEKAAVFFTTDLPTFLFPELKSSPR